MKKIRLALIVVLALFSGFNSSVRGHDDDDDDHDGCFIWFHDDHHDHHHDESPAP
jgi:hypothetical protein